MDAFQSYDPNVREAGAPVWAVYDGTRLRTFAQRGHAMNSFGHWPRAKLYEFEDGRWKLIAVFDPPNWPTDCERCNAPLVRPFKDEDKWSTYPYKIGDGKVTTGHLEFLRSRGKIISPVEAKIVCADCAQIVRSA